MKKNFESILQMVGDYHRFCNPTKPSEARATTAEDELSFEELELVAAAVKEPKFPETQP